MATHASTFFGAWCFSKVGGDVDSYDDMESYTDLVAVNGLNGGTGWLAAYADRAGNVGLQAVDDMESYTDLAAVNGLNGGIGWAAAYVDR